MQFPLYGTQLVWVTFMGRSLRRFSSCRNEFHSAGVDHITQNPQNDVQPVTSNLCVGCFYKVRLQFVLSYGSLYHLSYFCLLVLLSFLFNSLCISFGDISIFHYQKPVDAVTGIALLLANCLLFAGTSGGVAGFSVCVSQATSRETAQQQRDRLM